jgi:hypothetical protein
MILWQRSLPRITTVLVVVIVLGGCAVSERRAGPGADGTPAVAVACAQDTPDCEDTELVEDGLDDAASGIETTPPTPTATATESETIPSVRVAFATSGGDCADVTLLERSVAASLDPIEAAFRELVAGPTAEEAARGADTAIFSGETSQAIQSVTLDEGLLSVDFTDFRQVIANASTSCGSMSLLAQLNTTAFQFEEVERVRYLIDGSCDTFANWLQRECTEYTRAGTETAQS